MMKGRGSAIQIARDFISDFNLKSPLNLDEVCTINNIELKHVDIDAEAFLLCKNGKTKIIYNRNRNPHRIRFSIAHELGHYLIPWQEHLIYTCDENDMGNDSDKKEENEANDFASELLLPTNQLREWKIGDCTIELLIAIQEHFDVSLATAGIKVVNFFDKYSAIVFSIDEKIKWFFKGSNFDGFLKKGILNDNTFAMRTYTEKLTTVQKGFVLASEWTDEDTALEMYEETLPMRGLNAALTILRYKTY